MDRLQFTFQELLSVVGLAQCLLILVYMLFRAGGLLRALVPILYFAVLGGAFFFDLAFRFLKNGIEIYPLFQWFFWFSGLPLSFLLIIQIARLSEPPSLKRCAILFLIPAAFFFSAFAASLDESCSDVVFPPCESMMTWLSVSGLAVGAISLLAIWVVRDVMDGVEAQKMGRERFWLILALVGINILFLGLVLAGLSGVVENSQMILIRTVLGMGLAYVAGTSLFRIYPPSVRFASSAGADMGPEDQDLARRIEKLLDMDKVYHEPAYSRSDLARELGAAEASVSRVVNLHFGRSLTQLLNERRVEDAKRLLSQTDVPIRTVSDETGFNSLASFNRVFKDITGLPPGTYRQSVRVSNDEPSKASR
ncbi:MAG: helix-turn-helix transcriptional regulator [Rhodospirillales bacterium]|nr:helix-turn-helix transcriptional regulator [Rhodospirillales bacterium]